MSERFTAVIKIVKIEDTTERVPVSGSGRTETRGVSKDTELLSLTVRHNTLEGLIAKTTAHIALVEETK